MESSGALYSTLFALHLLPMLARRCPGVFAEDLVEIRGRAEAARGGDVFEFAGCGAEQVGGGFDAAALQPVVGAHAGFTFKIGKKSRTAGAGMSRESVHGDRLGKVALHVVDEMSSHADVRGGPGRLVMTRGFKNDRGYGHAQSGVQAIGLFARGMLADEGMQRLRQMPRARVHRDGVRCALFEVAGEPFALAFGEQGVPRMRRWIKNDGAKRGRLAHIHLPSMHRASWDGQDFAATQPHLPPAAKLVTSGAAEQQEDFVADV